MSRYSGPPDEDKIMLFIFIMSVVIIMYCIVKVCTTVFGVS